MSTRSIIVVTGKNYLKQPETTRIYKHSDGYPTGNLYIINLAIRRSQALVDEQNKRFGDNDPINTSLLCGAIISETLSVYGLGAQVDSRDNDPGIYGEKFDPKHLGNQFDLEWIYVIDLEAKSLNIYGGCYSESSAQDALKEGPVDPVLYANQLKDEHQAKERKEIAGLVSKIESLGFRVNKVNGKGKKNGKKQRAKKTPVANKRA